MRLRSGLHHAFLFCLGSIALFVSVTDAEEIQGRISWPSEWTVFAPFDRAHPVPDDDFFQTVPDAISTPKTPLVLARTAEARRIETIPGKPVDLADFFETQRVGNVAYVFLELDSPEPQTATLGLGADWWMQVWLNGEPVFDTMDAGNEEWPVSMLNHLSNIKLKEGTNVLAVRFITGRASSALAIGGPDEFPAAERREADRLAARRLNVMPERFEDRLVFPVDEQALVMARRGMQLPETDADLLRGDMAGLQPMPERQLRFRPLTFRPESDLRGELLDTLMPRFDDPVTLRLSKSRYPWEDRHLDAIVWTTPPEDGRLPRGRLEVTLKNADGAAKARHEILELSPSGLFFSVGFPEELQGSNGTLEVVWSRGNDVIGRAERPFHVKSPADTARSGRVPLRILNEPGASIPKAPMTVGVPFPRGAALHDELNVRLIDETGSEMPLQTRETARWSRYGPIKWLLCDFTVDLDGEPREIFLEYGPDVRRAGQAEISIGEPYAGFPGLDAGRIRVDKDGLSFDPEGSGNFQPVLSPAALQGAFVYHEDGRKYSMTEDAEYAFEELGSQKAVVRRTGWYIEPESGRQFCQFVTRFVFHRHSPVVRVFHTWIFTGDGNRDRIADMGWRFNTARPATKGAILTAFDGGEWLTNESLVQFDFDLFLLPDSGLKLEGRTPGVLSSLVGNSRVTFGVRDFWQNFPSELEVGEDGFTFYNWPRRNPPERFDRPVERSDAFRHRFVHEGEMLDFRIPHEYADGPIWSESSSREGHIAKDSSESVNAQGIARTEEMFLYFTDNSVSADEAAKVIRGLNDETLRAVADPAWVCASGAFGEIHHRDPENYPEAEHIFDLSMTAPPRWVERLGFYGMWLHGDYPTWSINLRDRTVSTYRTLRKNHHNYPYGWAPFARSGDPRMLKPADAATRQMTDANFCHYATADVDASVGPQHFRRQGWWDRSLLPWAGRSGPHLRSYTVDCDYLWHSYYMTGYTRARDVALLFGELTQHDHVAATSTQLRPRTTQSMMPSYLDMYQATFDPWFLASALEIADMYMHFYADLEPPGRQTRHPLHYGHTWRNAELQLFEFTGGNMHRYVALNRAKASCSQRFGPGPHHTDWGRANAYQAPFAWLLTGNDYYLARSVAALDQAMTGMYDGDLEYARGTIGNQIAHGNLPVLTTKWDGVGRVLYALERAGEAPEPVQQPSVYSGMRTSTEEYFGVRMPDAYIRKSEGEAIPIYLEAYGRGREKTSVWPDRAYGPYSYAVSGPPGEDFMEGEWRAPDRIEIPSEAPEGVYRINIKGQIPWPEDEYLLEHWGRDLSGARARFGRRHNRFDFPVSDPEIPEVMVFDRTEQGTRVPAPGQGFWFMVPEDAGEFWIEFNRSGGGRVPVNRVSVWNPDGERAYDLSYSGDPPPRVSIEVPTGHAGKLWRATGGPFLVDPQVAPYFSSTRTKWFDPEK